ncbi:hypothetical protein [Flavobacterium granuli]|uniref:Uncharacterized protein n=1 Tax=Flavobacterium granuli TaxID=280093 RepID=A0A1M5QU66_9FLAO|nr:hypothetical protein [Flavobacterium granuli]PRZ25294.1 hypothetical protein BC624_103387 [Flavobacterium granuli]SHH17684.1 hypothetical protein SAMN05443373_108140 [Flavobacterium granuli]
MRFPVNFFFQVKVLLNKIKKMLCKIKTIQLLTIFLAIINIGCEQKKTILNEKNIIDKSTVTKKTKTSTKITDSLKYNKYVFGTDEEGNHVQGKIIIEGKNGIGILIGKEDTEIEIVLEQVSHNKLIATDIDGFKYKLKFK